MALLVLLATEPEFVYTTEDLSLISKDSHQFNKNKGLWYTYRGKKILPQRQAEAVIKTDASVDSLRGKQAHPDIFQA